MEKINKTSIIITSLGRTGTKFFASYFKEITSNATVYHEPGMFNYKKMNLKQINTAIKVRGLNDAVIKKLLNIPELKKISKWRLERRIDENRAVQMIIKQRKKFIESFSAPVYIESNYMYQGLIDILPQAFENIKILYIVRDPRDWVRSFINWRGLYHWTDIQLILGNRITPLSVGDKKYAVQYRRMGQFEKLCWAWNYINRRAINAAENTPQATWCRFEDIFNNPRKVEKMTDIVYFLSGGDSSYIKLVPDYRKKTAELLQKKVHQPQTYFFPTWKDWTREQAKILNSHCGKLMERLGYGEEIKWQNLIIE